MIIYVDPSDLRSCEKCGVVYVKKKIIPANDKTYSPEYAVCPLCKHKNWYGDK